MSDPRRQPPLHANIAGSEATIASVLVREWPTNPSGFMAKVIAEAPRCFIDERIGRIVAAGRQLAAEGIPVEVDSLAPRSEEGALVGFLAGGQATPDLAEVEAKTVWRDYIARDAAEELQSRCAALYADPDAALETLPGALASIGERVLSLKATGLSLRERVKARVFRASKRPSAPETRFTLGGVPIATPGNIVAISAGVKSGKSSLVAASMASLLAPTTEGRDFLGVEGRNPHGLAVLHFDTEQSPFDHWQLIDRALRRAGVPQEPPWFRSYCLTGFPFNEARQSVFDLAEDARGELGGIHSVFIDGAADLVADVNDPEECNAFVAQLHGKAIDWHAPIIALIHVNPNSEKTRGHLGSQLERKAETNLRLEKDGETIVAWSEKNRGAPIPKESAPRFQWSDSDRMHVSTQSLGADRLAVKRVELREIAVAAFNAAGKAALAWADLVSHIGQLEGLKASGSRKKLEAMQKAGVIAKSGVLGTYTLTP